MSKLDKDQVIADFTEAYTKANGKAPTIEAKSGWYSVDGGKNIRLAQIAEMTAELAGGAPVTAEPAPKAAPAKKKAAPKKAQPASKPAAKAKGGFSVKAFWNEVILGNKPGSKQPR